MAYDHLGEEVFMLRFPAPPDTLLTRQLECISCKEIFTVSEDYALPDRQRTEYWQLPSDHLPDTQLRYQPDRTRRSVTPETRAMPNRAPHRISNWAESRRVHVNCPRCGADNRNWLHVSNIPRSASSLATFQQWRQRFAPATIGVFVTLALVAAAFWNVYKPEAIGNGLTLVIVILLAGFLSINTITRQWRALREYHYRRAFVSPHSLGESLSPTQQTGLRYFAIFVFLVPFLLYVFIPKSFGLASSIFTPSTSKATLSERIDSLFEPLEQELAETEENEAAAEVEEPKAVIRPVERLEILLKLEPKEDDALTVRLESVLEKARNEVLAAPDSNLIKQIEPEIEALEEVVPPLDVNNIDTEFLRTWLKYVGLASVVSIVFSMMAVTNYTNRMDAQLPRPLFYSIANMTRVVIWEAKRSLEIPGQMDHVQWINVERNAQGGITLQGLHRDPSQTLNEDLNFKVRAQRYTIHSDIWGRIQSAEIKDLHVWQPVPLFQEDNLKEDALRTFFQQAVQVTRHQEEVPPPEIRLR
jgi:hypothetical protein